MAKADVTGTAGSGNYQLWCLLTYFTVTQAVVKPEVTLILYRSALLQILSCVHMFGLV